SGLNRGLCAAFAGLQALRCGQAPDLSGEAAHIYLLYITLLYIIRNFCVFAQDGRAESAVFMIAVTWYRKIIDGCEHGCGIGPVLGQSHQEAAGSMDLPDSRDRARRAPVLQHQLTRIDDVLQ